MNITQILQLIVSIASALAVIIPLGIKLYHTIVELSQEKNWPRLVAAASKYMEQAEELLSEGAARKEWVMAMLKTTANQLNYTLTEVDIANLEDLIDRLCEMSKKVNPPIKEIEEAAE